MKKTLLLSLLCTIFCLSQAMEKIPAAPSTEESQLYEFKPLFEKHKEGIRSSIEQGISETSQKDTQQNLKNLLQMIDDPKALPAVEKAFNEPEYHDAFMDFAKKTRPDASAEEIRNIMIPAWVKARKLLFKKYGKSPENWINASLSTEIACSVAHIVGGEEKLFHELVCASIAYELNDPSLVRITFEESNSNSNSKTE